MATYGTDLTTLNDAQSGSWYEFTASGWDVGDNPTPNDADYFIQGTACAVSDTNNKTGICSGAYDAGSDISGSFTDGVTVALIWHVLLPGNAMDTYANNGLRVVVGASLTAFTWWAVGGRDVGRNPYGGWQNYAVDPSISGTDVGGGHGGAYRYFGAATLVTSNISKGTMHGWDAIRYGRGEIYCTGTGATFGGLAQYNDYNDATNGYRRYGLFQEQGVGSDSYLWKGLMSLGQSGTSVTFSDSDKAILVDDTPAVYSTFNRIAIRNASSSVTWNNITIKALGSTSPGELEVVENATVSFDGCSFQKMGTFTFLSNSTITGCIFKSCALVDTGGGEFTGSKVLTSTVAADASALLWDDPNDPDGYLDDMVFSKGTNAHHAIELGTSSPATVTLRGWTTSGFNASDGQNDSTIYLADKGTDTAWTINVIGGSGNFTYKKARSGDTVTMNIDPVTTKVTVKDGLTKAAVEGAAVTLRAAGSGPYPYNLSVTSLTQSGGTATCVTASAHNLATGQKVWIKGATPNAYNRIKTITVTATDTFTYPIDSGTSSPATGTITCTAVFIDAVTGATGIVSDSRVFSSGQAVAGHVSKGTVAPFYVRQEMSDEIDDTDGLSLTVLLQTDE